MPNFIETLFQAQRVTTPKAGILGLFFLMSGSYLGYCKAKKQAQIANLDTSLENLSEYVSEDHLDLTIDETNKPAVIYYYQPGTPFHYVIRHAMIQSSNRYKDNATFWMVNLTKKLHYTKQQLKMKFPINWVLLEIRFPNDKCEVKYTNGQIVEEENVKRRQFFNHHYRDQTGVEAFLEQNGIKPAHDPLKLLFNVTSNSLFADLNILVAEKKQQ